MAVKKFKPVTAGTRHKIIGTFEEITTNKPEKSLLSPKKSSGGRNNSGKMTVRYIGGGHKQMYRNIDFKRTKDGIAALAALSSASVDGDYCVLLQDGQSGTRKGCAASVRQQSRQRSWGSWTERYARRGSTR